MRERGITLNADMVRAVLKGSKTQTRRIMKVQPVSPELELSRIIESTRRIEDGKFFWREPGSFVNNRRSALFSCPFGAVGDHLWVRETWSDVNLEGAPAVAYRADNEVYDLMEEESLLDEDGAFNYQDPRVSKYHFAAWYSDLISGVEGNWRPSIHMPRWASRITLEITGVRVERLNSISGADAKAEGAHWSDGKPNEMGLATELVVNAKDEFAHLWRSIYGEESWQANPWVWVIAFKRVEGE